MKNQVETIIKFTKPSYTLATEALQQALKDLEVDCNSGNLTQVLLSAAALKTNLSAIIAPLRLLQPKLLRYDNQLSRQERNAPKPRRRASY